jgi:hypothetical protein
MKGAKDSEWDFNSYILMQLSYPSQSLFIPFYFTNTHISTIKHNFNTTNITTRPSCLSPSGNLDRLHLAHFRLHVSLCSLETLSPSSFYSGSTLSSRLGTQGLFRLKVSQLVDVPADEADLWTVPEYLECGKVCLKCMVYV